MVYFIMVLWCVIGYREQGCVIFDVFIFMYSGVLFVKVNVITVQWFVVGDCLYHHGTVVCYW